jgi:hypothetical protein
LRSLEEATGKCFVTCFQDECLVLGDNYCGPPLDFSKLEDRARLMAAIHRLSAEGKLPAKPPSPSTPARSARDGGGR